MDEFPAICSVVLGHEGGFTAAPEDPGNWTGGAVNHGVCKGTKFGISAASFPTVDIAGLTLEGATAIYRALYWARVQGDALPPAFALLVFDAAVNNGVHRAICWLQASVGAVTDGLIGTGTLRALSAKLAQPGGLDAVRCEFMAQRVVFMAALDTWPTYGLGWARRLMRLPFQSIALSAPV